MKVVKQMSIFFFCLFFLAGCGNNTKELDKALENMQNLESAKISVQMEVGNEEYSMITSSTSEMVRNGEVMHSTTVLSLGGTSMASESYAEKKDDKVYQYITQDGGKTWAYTIEESIDTDANLDTVHNLAGEYKKAKKVTSDIDGHEKYELTIDKDTMNEALEKENAGGMKLTSDLTIDVYVKSGYIVRMVLDLGKSVDTTELGGVNKIIMTILVSNPNEVEEIEIPNEVKENAVLRSDEEE